MPQPPPELPDIHYGTAEGELPDWRKSEDDDEDPDDEELPETPPEIIEILGFDPLDLDEDEPDAEQAAPPD